jgi:hypothetical protein
MFNYNKNLQRVQAWWHKPVIPTFWRLSWEGFNSRTASAISQHPARKIEKKLWINNLTHTSILENYKS